MNVSLTPELESLVNEKVQTGMYQTASEVVREALRLLKERDETKLRELREMIQAGIGQLERGEYTEYDPANVKALAVAVRDRGRRRLTRLRKTGTR
jgi:antitoxin ParD1/3/4